MRKVFFDANIVIQAGKPPGGPLVDRVADLSKGGFIDVLTTDLTITEVVKRHVENDYEAIKSVTREHFRVLIEELLGTKLPAMSKDAIEKNLRERYSPQVISMFEALEARVLKIDTIAPSKVFDDYAAGSGFFSGSVKKDQFPDAFIFECLKIEASAKTPVTVVSADSDFETATATHRHFQLLKSIPELFKELGLEIDAPEVRPFLMRHQQEICKLATNEINNWGLDATDVEDAEIDDVEVTKIDFNDLTSFKATEDGRLLVIGTATIKMTASYTHPDWDSATYDSEDKILIPHDDVSGEAEITTEANFSMSIAVDDSKSPRSIEDFRFRDDEFRWIELHSDDYLYR